MKKKIMLLLVAVLLVSVAATGGVWAILHDQGTPVVNEFVMKPEIEIKEDFNKKIKKNVKVYVKNSSEPLCFRAKIIYTLKDADGSTLSTVPVEGQDYDVSLNLGQTTGTWFYNDKDGFYYYNGIVEKTQYSGELIKTCETKNKNYELCVDVLVQSVEANKDAIKEAWGIDISALKTE